MAYLVANNDSITIRHPVRTVGGVLKTGEQANITSTLSDAAGASSAISVTIAEIGSTGWYGAELTPTATGNWVLTLTNPAGTDEAIVEYGIQVTTGGAIVAGGTDLTTLTRVRSSLYTGTTSATTDHDVLIANLIDEVSDAIQQFVGNVIGEATYTEYYSGMGEELMMLRHGPLVSVTSVNEVTYSATSSVDTSRTETLSEVYEYERLEGGLRSENYKGRGWLELVGGKFTPGQRNYKVVYTAGFSSIPNSLVLAATNAVVYEFKRRERVGFQTNTAGDASVSFMTDNQMRNALERAVAPFKTWGVA